METRLDSKNKEDDKRTRKIKRRVPLGAPVPGSVSQLKGLKRGRRTTRGKSSTYDTPPPNLARQNKKLEWKSKRSTSLNRIYAADIIRFSAKGQASGGGDIAHCQKQCETRYTAARARGGHCFALNCEQVEDHVGVGVKLTTIRNAVRAAYQAPRYHRLSVPSPDHLLAARPPSTSKGGARKVPTVVSRSLICCSQNT